MRAIALNPLTLMGSTGCVKIRANDDWNRLPMGSVTQIDDDSSRDTYEKHELRKSLPDMVFHARVLLFAAGILWEQASGGRRKLLPEV